MRRALVIGFVAFAAAMPARALCKLRSAAEALASVDGRDAVPINLVLFAEFAAEGDTLTARSQDDDDVVLFTPLATDGFVRIEAERELQPNTDYVLCSNGVFDTCASFRTANARDDVAPAPPVASLDRTEGFSREPECGGPYSGTAVVILAEAVDDVGAMVLRRSISGGQATTRRVEQVQQGDEVALIDVAEEGGEASYDIRAFDLAGQESEATIVAASLGCPGSCAQTSGVPLGLTLGALLISRRDRHSRRRTRV